MIATEDRIMIRGDARSVDLESVLAGLPGVHRSGAALNRGLRLVVEMATFASLVYWGASISGSVALRASLAVIAPLVGIVAWSRLLAPRAPGRLVGFRALVVDLSIFAIATWALFSSGMGHLGAIYGSLAVANALLTHALGQYAVATGMLAGTAR